ncbi:SDR family oxidoreductase [Streptococcus downei]|mgnify:CR=1 FL=1|uniref:NmrA-like dehydrogenase/reductase n=1 Tax=Streptococcus downei MFe28 TaxID=764290 RepID=A0A380JEH0_STRDO|nr:SDR family oxidoreductase [Streptococcus downei]EFQ56214.1 NmrA family protein [Streptococcus downei F0415]SUN35797.1 NmrA-like dehydrogenase/reductase [Streptococcus downei MFe28]
MTLIALTGVTGHLGGQVAKLLERKNLNLRYLARRPEKAPKVAGVPVFQSAYDRSQETLEALSGVDVLLMVSASESLNRLAEHRAFIDSAKEAGVKHIVYASFYNASLQATFTYSRTHAATENYIKERGFTYTFIRDNFYLDFFLELGQVYGEIKGPAGDGKVSAVARQDVAQVLAKILEHPSDWVNQTLDMTGPEDLTMTQVTGILSQGLGKTVSYIPETVEEAYQSRKAWPAEDWEYDGWVSTYTAIAGGEQAGLSKDVQRVLGREPISLADLIKEATQE